MWGQFEIESGYWSSAIWIIFFSLIVGVTLTLRFVALMEFNEKSGRSELPLSGQEAPEDEAKAAVPASSLLSCFLTALEPVYLCLSRLNSGMLSDSLGYFLLSLAFWGVLMLF